MSNFDIVDDAKLATEYLDCNDLRKIPVKDIDPIVKELPMYILEKVPCDILRKLWCFISDDKQTQLIEHLPCWNHYKSETNENSQHEKINCKDCQWFFADMDVEERIIKTLPCPKHNKPPESLTKNCFLCSFTFNPFAAVRFQTPCSKCMGR